MRNAVLVHYPSVAPRRGRRESVFENGTLEDEGNYNVARAPLGRSQLPKEDFLLSVYGHATDALAS